MSDTKRQNIVNVVLTGLQSNST